MPANLAEPTKGTISKSTKSSQPFFKTSIKIITKLILENNLASKMNASKCFQNKPFVRAIISLQYTTKKCMLFIDVNLFIVWGGLAAFIASRRTHTVYFFREDIY